MLHNAHIGPTAALVVSRPCDFFGILSPRSGTSHASPLLSFSSAGKGVNNPGNQGVDAGLARQTTPVLEKKNPSPAVRGGGTDQVCIDHKGGKLCEK